jgi:hypothetical protein
MLVLALLAILAAAVPASAQTTDVTTCQALIDQVRLSTETTTFVNTNDQTGLLGKLASATSKLEQGKPADALRSLTQFQDKVETLVLQGKLDAADADILLTGDADSAGVNEAITCVASLAA